MAKQTYLDQLAAVPLFSACSKKDLQKIAKASDELDVAEGRELCVQGDASREAFVLVEGTATVKRNNRKVATLTEGACIGELGLLDKGPRTATVTMDGPGRVLVLGPREFSGLLEEVPGLSHKLMRTLASRVRDLDKKTYG